VSPGGELTRFSQGLAGIPTDMVAGPDGNLWFTAQRSIGRVTPSGEITLFKAGIGLEPQSIVAGPDGRVWFSGGSNGIERITPPQAPVNTFIVNPGKVSTGGVAEVPVEVPGPGEVKLRKAVVLLSHKRTMQLPGSGALHVSPATCGAAPLRLKLRGKALARQRKEGSIRVRVTATFTATGGSPNTSTETTFLRGQRRGR